MQYMTLSENIRKNGDRHKANAERYLSQGLPEYAAGSMRKAEKNYKRADEIEEIFKLPKFLEPFYKEVKEAMARNIFNSNG